MVYSTSTQVCTNLNIYNYLKKCVKITTYKQRADVDDCAQQRPDLHMDTMILKIAVLLILWLTGLAGPVFADEILNGAGATFPSPFYKKLIEEYQKRYKTRIDYQSVGSGLGIKLLIDKKVDFGASDIFISDNDLEQPEAPIFHIPSCVGAVAVIYNLPSKPSLKLDSELLANLLMGKITHWSDEKINAVNDLPLKKLDVTVVHRSDSSGTTFILTDYLTKTNERWKTKIGCGKMVEWPVGMGVERNCGVAEIVSRIPGSIGYVSLSYAAQKGLEVASLKNRSGRFIKPTQDSVFLAANVSLPEDCRLLITDTVSEKGYPISAFTFILVYRNQAYNNRTRKKAESLINFLAWIVGEGQQYTKPLHYAPLPDEAIKRAKKMIGSIYYDNKNQ